jgi:signal transduction histidine kinase
VSNARRHGNAHSIYIRLSIEPTRVRLEVLDDGIGVASPTAGSTGMGLKIMRFRAAIIGADLSIGPGDHGRALVTVACTQP